MGPEKPGKSLNFIAAFSRTESPGKKGPAGPEKFWKYVKLLYKYEMYGRPYGELTLRS